MKRYSYLLEQRLRFRLFFANLVPWIAGAVLLRSRWIESWNGTSASLLIPAVYIGAVVAAQGAYLARRREEAHRNAVWAVSSRSRTVATLLGSGLDLLCVAVLPYACYAATLLIGGRLAGTQGRLLVAYGVFTGIFLVAVYLLGVIISAVAHSVFVATTLAFLAGLYFGMYLVRPSDEIDTWSAFPAEALVLVVVLAVTVLISSVILTRMRYGYSARPAQILSLSSTAGIVAGVYLLGGFILDSYERQDTDNYVCKKAGVDVVCVWKEDSYKLASVTDQLGRLRALTAGRSYDAPPMLILEPVLPSSQISDKYSMDNIVMLRTVGGDNPSWPAAQSLADTIPVSSCRNDSISEVDKGERSFLLGDIAANYVYGDIDYQGFATADAAHDQNRIDVTGELAKLPEKEQLTWMRGKLDEFMQRCTFDPDV